MVTKSFDLTRYKFKSRRESHPRHRRGRERFGGGARCTNENSM
jgi:hypothetical protein